MQDDFGGFFVSISVLESKVAPAKMFKQDIPIPIANGYVIIGCNEESLAFNASNFELVTIHTIKEIISNIEDAVVQSRDVYKIENNKIKL